MTTRRKFIAQAAAGVAVATVATTTAVPTPAQAAPPSSLALELARSLQRSLPAAKLSDALVAKIAGDIQDNFAIATTFRKTRLKNWDEPDCAFSADPVAEHSIAEIITR